MKRVQILIDNRNSWMWEYIYSLEEKINSIGFHCKVLSNHEDVNEGDILILLSCNRIFKKLELNTYNLVVHESDLPKGKGWSPMSWQVIEGKNKIPITLFEASEDVDAGSYYFKDKILLTGHELVDEIRELQAKKTFEMILKFLESKPFPKPIKQKGEGTYYKKRTQIDSRLDKKKSIIENFNLLRVCDNENYPAFFEYMGNQYVLKIYKKTSQNESSFN